ncbi:hypothetical protein PAHAL_4G058200 [Panicum hallii]|uniref:Uncharacterized protein n=1 Tax=Panicum hallii TaxID=206008 RepID=A0A2T8JBX8_9POAL|nr:hypothetical protein PAHAL_4G058200 [Panicum hallii]
MPSTRTVGKHGGSHIAAASSLQIHSTSSRECGILNLHQDVQTCGYQDVQVMWNMLSSEKEAVGTGAGGTLPKPRKRPFWRLPLWPVRPPTRTAAQRD